MDGPSIKMIAFADVIVRNSRYTYVAVDSMRASGRVLALMSWPNFIHDDKLEIQSHGQERFVDLLLLYRIAVVDKEAKTH